MHFLRESLPPEIDEVIVFNDSNISLDKNGHFDISGVNILDGLFNKENKKKFGGRKLIFRDCKKLKSISVNTLGLTSIRLEGCSELEKISAYNNRLKELDLNGLSNPEKLEDLNVSYNLLKSLEIKKFVNLKELKCQNNLLEGELNLGKKNKLKELDCSYNSIEKLEVSNLENIEKISCNDNELLEFIPSGLKKLNFLNCSNNFKEFSNESFSPIKIKKGLNKLKLNDCASLEVLDASENSLKNLELISLEKLWNVACKNNELSELKIKECPSIKVLECSQQNDKIVLFRKDFFKELKEKIEEEPEGDVEFLLDSFLIYNSWQLFDMLLLKDDEDSLKLFKVNEFDEILNLFSKNPPASILGHLEVYENREFFDLLSKKIGYLFSDGSTAFSAGDWIETNLHIDKESRKNLFSLSHSEFTKFYDYETSESIELTKDYFPVINEVIRGDFLFHNEQFENMIDERKRQEEEEEQARLKAEWEKNNPSSGSYSHQSTTNSGGKKSNKYYGPANWYPPLDKSEEADLDISQKHIRGHLTLEDWPKLRKINVGNNELTNLTVYDCPELVWLNYAHNKFDSGVFAFIDKCPNLKEENIHNENCDGHYDWTQDLTEEERKKYEEQGKDPVRLLLEQTEHLTWEEILFELQKLGSSDQIDRNLAGIIAQIIKHKFETELIYIIIKYRDTKELSKEQFLEEIRIREPHFKSLLSDFTRSQLKRVLSSLTDKSYQSVSRNTSVWPWIFVGLGWVIFILIFNYLVIIRVKNRD